MAFAWSTHPSRPCLGPRKQPTMPATWQAWHNPRDGGDGPSRIWTPALAELKVWKISHDGHGRYGLDNRVAMFSLHPMFATR